VNSFNLVSTSHSKAGLGLHELAAPSPAGPIKTDAVPWSLCNWAGLVTPHAARPFRQGFLQSGMQGLHTQ